MTTAIATRHLGDRDRCFERMHRAFDVRDPCALALRVENLWDDARHDPRYQGLLRRVGLAD